MLGLGSEGSMEPIARAFRALPGVETITFFEKAADLTYDFVSDTFQDILARLPTGWEPDIVAIWSPEYFPVPVGIEESPYPTLALVQDWNLRFHEVHAVMPCFDYIFTDQRGAEVLTRAGHQHVEPILMYAFDPQTYRRLPDAERVWDIGIVANLNHRIHRERARWLARIAQLGDKYRVRISWGLWGEAYARALNQTKITFNRSIAGAMNLRAYEAPACGSLLFLEEENLEVQETYQDRVHCVLYNAANLEELLDYYLSHNDEREQIVEAASERVRDYTYERQVARWVQRIQSLGVVGRSVRTRRLGATPAEKHCARATQAFRIQSPGGAQVADRELGMALAAAPNDPTVLNNLGVLYGAVATGLDDDDGERQLLEHSLQSLNAAIQEFPGHAVAYANLGEVYVRRGNVAAAELVFEQALSALSADSGELLRDAWLLLPSLMGTFYVEYEWLSAEFADDPEGFAEAARDLYRWWLWERVGDQRLEKSDWEPARAAYEQALTARSLGSTHHSLARALVALGRVGEALEELKVAIEEEPFLLQARADLAGLLLRSGDHVGARRACEEALRLIRACPNYESSAPPFHAMLGQCLTLRAETGTVPPGHSRLEDLLG